MTPPHIDGVLLTNRRATVPFYQGIAPERQTYMTQLIIKMQDSLHQLDIDTECDETCRRMEEMAILIHESMSISSRNYHSVQHVFDISKNLSDPIAILAALFHDCVYFHVDGGLSDKQQAILRDVVCSNSDSHPGGNNNCRLSDKIEDPLLRMVATVFNFEEGQELTPFGGINEFLSAVLAVRELQSLLPMPILAQIAACIEATIPFRAPDANGVTATDKLFGNLVQANEEFNLGLNEAQLTTAVQRAVLLANEDVGNFATQDGGYFLDNTWNLLPESNAALRHQYLYTVGEFQFSLFKMYGFFSFLKPSVVFLQYKGVPNKEEYEHRTMSAGRNIEVGKKYVAATLLSTSLLAAFAELTGGDAPISLFMGDLPSRYRVSRRMEDNLPKFSRSELEKRCDPDVYTLLLQGRRSETTFDIKQDPLAAYLYASMGDEGVSSVLKDVKTYPMDQEVARDLLGRLPRTAVELVADNVATIAPSRSEQIREIIHSLPAAEERNS